MGARAGTAATPRIHRIVERDAPSRGAGAPSDLGHTQLERVLPTRKRAVMGRSESHARNIVPYPAGFKRKLGARRDGHAPRAAMTLRIAMLELIRTTPGSRDNISLWSRS